MRVSMNFVGWNLLLALILGMVGLMPTPAQAGTAGAGIAHQNAVNKAASGVDVKSTLENLQTAFNGESNAQARYLAFATKAHVEGYGAVASLFRAAARSEEIHARNHAAVIKKMGGTPVADIKMIAVNSTRENLATAIAGESYENSTMYPAFIFQARKDKNVAALRTFNSAKRTELEHAKLYREALANLAAWKGGPKIFYVCPVCGFTAAKIDFVKCPVCRTAKEKFEAIK